MPVATATPRRLSADARKQQIVETVLDLVATRGADAVTTQSIADVIGLSQPAVFRHFPTKEAIWVAVLDWLDEQLAGIHQNAGADKALKPLDALEQMFLAHIKLIVRFPALAKLVFSDHLRLQYPGLNERFAAIHAAYQARVIELIRRAKLEGEAGTEVAPKHGATLYFCMVQGLGFQLVIARLLVDALREAKHIFALYRRAVTQA